MDNPFPPLLIALLLARTVRFPYTNCLFPPINCSLYDLSSVLFIVRWSEGGDDKE